MRRLAFTCLSLALLASPALAGCGSCGPLHCEGADGEVVQREAAAPSGHCEAMAAKAAEVEVPAGSTPSQSGQQSGQDAPMRCDADLGLVREGCGGQWLVHPAERASVSPEETLLPVLGSSEAPADAVGVSEARPPDRLAVGVVPANTSGRLFELHRAYLI